MLDEATQIEAARKGQLTAFNQLVLQYQQVAYNVAFRLMGNEDEASDATQEAFIKAFKSLEQFHSGSFKAWLIRIVTNTCYDLLRVRQRRYIGSLEAMQEDEEHPVELPDRGERPEEYVLRSELRGLIQRGIGTLPEDQRTVLVLFDIEGFSYQEIAQITGTEMGTVKSRLSRARGRLRDYLQTHQALGTPTRTGDLNRSPADQPTVGNPAYTAAHAAALTLAAGHSSLALACCTTP